MILHLPVNESIDFSSNAREDVPVNRSFKKRIFLLPFLSILSVFFPVFLGCSKDRYPQKARVSVLTGAGFYLQEQDMPLVTIPYNTEVTVTAADDLGYTIQYQGKTGRIVQRQLTITEQPLRTVRYAKGIEGVPVYGSPGGQILAYIDNGAELLCMGGFERMVDRAGGKYLESWIQVSTATVRGWVEGQKLSFDPIQYYFASIARSGLNVRSDPSLNAPIVGLVPFKKSGRAFYRLRDTFTVENRRGAWMKVEYGDKVGWVFSGFALLGTSPDFSHSYALSTLEYFESLFTEPRAWAVADNPIRITPEKRLQNGYEIYTSREKTEELCDPGLRTTVFLREEVSKKQYIIEAEDSVSVTPGPLENMLHVKLSHCRCCCPHITDHLLVLLPNRLLAYPYQPQSVGGAGSCYYGPIYVVSFGQEMRRSADGSTLYAHLKYPSCAVEGPSTDYVTEIVESEEFVSELFVRMHFNDMQSEPQIDRVFNEGVPEKYKAEWDAARPFRQEAQAPY